jgi:hypothetical protein
MNWRRARYLASGVLIAGALLSGATVGSAVLLGSAEQRGDPVGRLSAHLEAGSVTVAAARGSHASAVGHPESSRGAQAPPGAVVTAASPPPPPPPAPPSPPAPIRSAAASATSPARTTHAEVEVHPGDSEHGEPRGDDPRAEPDD